MRRDRAHRRPRAPSFPCSGCGESILVGLNWLNGVCRATNAEKTGWAYATASSNLMYILMTSAGCTPEATAPQGGDLSSAASMRRFVCQGRRGGRGPALPDSLPSALWWARSGHPVHVAIRLGLPSDARALRVRLSAAVAVTQSGGGASASRPLSAVTSGSVLVRSPRGQAAARSG